MNVVVAFIDCTVEIVSAVLKQSQLKCAEASSVRVDDHHERGKQERKR
jgi:hypothetical protein